MIYLTKTEKPFGVTLLSAFHVMIGVLLALQGLGLLARYARLLGLRSGVVGGGLVVFAFIAFVLAYGLWTGRRWSWTVAVGCAVLGILFAVLSLFVRPRVGPIIELLLYVLVIYYLMQPRVQAYLGRSVTSSATHE